MPADRHEPKLLGGGQPEYAWGHMRQGCNGFLQLADIFLIAVVAEPSKLADSDEV